MSDEQQPKGYGIYPIPREFLQEESSNSGRPRGAQSFAKIAKRLFKVRLPVRVGEGTVSMPYLQALVHTHKTKALAGNAKSARAWELLMAKLGLLDEPVEREPVGVIVLPADVLRPNEEEWTWRYQRWQVRQARELERQRLANGDAEDPKGGPSDLKKR